MNDDDDFFAGEDYDGYDDSDDGTRQARRVRRQRHHEESVRRRADVLSAKGRRLGHVATLVGVLAMLAGLASATHEIAPAAIGVLQPVPGRWIAAIAGALVVVTIVLIATARHSLPRTSSRTSVGNGGVIALLAAILLLVLGIVVGILFPKGIVQPPVRDSAPVTSVQQMKSGLEAAAGPCTDGWVDIPTGGYPGVGAASACKATTVAYATFDSSAMERLYRGAIQGEILKMFADHADQAPANVSWRLLSGGRWVAFGPQPAMEKLQQAWGGTITPVDTGDTDGTGA